MSSPLAVRTEQGVPSIGSLQLAEKGCSVCRCTAAGRSAQSAGAPSSFSLLAFADALVTRTVGGSRLSVASRRADTRASAGAPTPTHT